MQQNEILPEPWAFRLKWSLEVDTKLLRNFSMPFSDRALACSGHNIGDIEHQAAMASMVHRYDYQLET